jgi:hypothetical protein
MGHDSQLIGILVFGLAEARIAAQCYRALMRTVLCYAVIG